MGRRTCFTCRRHVVAAIAFCFIIRCEVSGAKFAAEGDSLIKNTVFRDVPDFFYVLFIYTFQMCLLMLLVGVSIRGKRH